MEDVIGRRTDPRRFVAFLADWRPILAWRVDEAVAALSAVAGVRGLVRAGGVGRGSPRPLSDINLLPIYDEEWLAGARAEIERGRPALLDRWVDDG